MKRIWAVLLFLIVPLLLSAHTQAQEIALPSVDPASCTIEPAEIVPPIDAGDLNAPSPTPSPIATAPASPADVETASAVIERIAQSIACQNADDLPRMIANFSPGWITDRFSGYDLVFILRFYEAAESPNPLAEADRIELAAIGEVLVRDDGTAIATVTTRQHGAERESLLALVSVDGAWLIDHGQILVTN